MVQTRSIGEASRHKYRTTKDAMLQILQFGLHSPAED
jgi:hypothetical protein